MDCNNIYLIECNRIQVNDAMIFMCTYELVISLPLINTAVRVYPWLTLIDNARLLPISWNFGTIWVGSLEEIRRPFSFEISSSIVHRQSLIC